MSQGIYEIVNRTNNKFYVGSSVNIFTRWNIHKKSLRKGTSHCKILQLAWNKYGEENFELSIIEEVSDRALLIEREQHYLDALKPEYNTCTIAGNTLGYRHTKETREKMSGKNHPMYGKMGENNPNYGSHRSEETRLKISTARKGQFLGRKRPDHSVFMKELWAKRRGMQSVFSL